MLFLDCIIFTQICIGGENVGKISREKLWFYKKKKCCKTKLAAPCFRLF